MATNAPNTEQHQQPHLLHPKEHRKRPLDSDGFRLLAKHRTRRITSTAPRTVKLKGNTNILSTNPLTNVIPIQLTPPPSSLANREFLHSLSDQARTGFLTRDF
ncbi:hypothetical protein CEXT_290431 [Caerostris extrusa]|uniref:Uncharacterized protein n=1 Tax=Caerostris extrusa TaxID=172846 RepID=A0AAV4YDT8_CAEEX|nr:hypothetical protein CEXT_290431 [Caerostris extrusa]